jgi:hypothetical protein
MMELEAMWTRAVRVVALVVTLASGLGELSRGYCSMDGSRRPHACCEGPRETVQPSCCHAHPADRAVARASAPVVGGGFIGPADWAPIPASAIGGQLSTRPPVPDHSPPVLVLRV